MIPSLGYVPLRRLKGFGTGLMARKCEDVIRYARRRAEFDGGVNATRGYKLGSNLRELVPCGLTIRPVDPSNRRGKSPSGLPLKFCPPFVCQDFTGNASDLLHQSVSFVRSDNSTRRDSWSFASNERFFVATCQ